PMLYHLSCGIPHPVACNVFPDAALLLVERDAQIWNRSQDIGNILGRRNNVDSSFWITCGRTPQLMAFRLAVRLQKYAGICIEELEHAFHKITCGSINTEARIRCQRYLSQKLQIPSQALLRLRPIRQYVTQQNQAHRPHNESIPFVAPYRRRKITQGDEEKCRHDRDRYSGVGA